MTDAVAEARRAIAEAEKAAREAVAQRCRDLVARAQAACVDMDKVQAILDREDEDALVDLIERAEIEKAKVDAVPHIPDAPELSDEALAGAEVVHNQLQGIQSALKEASGGQVVVGSVEPKGATFRDAGPAPSESPQGGGAGESTDGSNGDSQT